MSGVVGLFDPDGPDVGRVERAALAGSSHRGSPVVRSVGDWALGVLVDDSEHADFLEDGGGVTIADARIDTVLPGGPPVPPGPARRLGPLVAAISSNAAPTLSGIVGDYAAAHLDAITGTITLVRDAFGLRPLFWAVRDGRSGFASDIETLVALGLADGSVDADAVRRLLFEQGEYGDRTVYAGVRRVEAGHWVQLGEDGSALGGRWFRPEAVRPDSHMTLARAGALTREAIVSAVVDRARSGRVALLLSAGRDSSSIAVALAEAGIRATCLTYAFDRPGVPSESPRARELALSLGHEWRELLVQPRVEPARAAEIAGIAGRPVNGVGGPIQLAMYDAIKACDAEVVMSGEGGDLLFAAFPIGILDLLRRGKLSRAMATVRSFDEQWMYGPRFVAKVLLRGVSPRWLLEARERRRPHPPWLSPPTDIRVRVDRSDEGYLRGLMSEGSDATEVPERLVRHAGATFVSPLVDLRVVAIALRFPVELRLPYPTPKPVLDEALLGERGRGLVKASLAGYVESLPAAYRADFPSAYGAGSLGARMELTLPEGLGAAGDKRWSWQAADLAGLEMWLRWLKERYDT